MQIIGVHPPTFRRDHRLADWPDCALELRCPRCGWSTFPGIRLLLSQFGNPTFDDLLPRLVCKRCRIRFAPVYLLAGQHREFCYGGPPDWAIELVPVPR